MTLTTLLRSPARAAGLLCCFALAGCGPPAPGSVAGTIKLQGKPPKLSGLEIVFECENGSLVAAAVHDDGTYKADGVQPGTAKVYFSALTEEAVRTGQAVQAGGRLKKPGGEKAPKAPPPKLDGNYPKVNPLRPELRDANSSKLTVTVASSGTTTFDYDLP